MSEIQFVYNHREAKAFRWLLFIPVTVAAVIILEVVASAIAIAFGLDRGFGSMLLGHIALLAGLIAGLKFCPSPRIVGALIQWVCLVAMTFGFLFDATYVTLFHVGVTCAVAIYLDRKEKFQTQQFPSS